jgi:flagellar hook-associated protein 3 FlgL
MTRITNFNQHLRVTSYLLRASEEQAKTQQQIASGKKVTSFADLSGDTGVLLSAKRVEANLEQYSRTANEVLNRLNVQDIQMRELENAAGDLRQAVNQAIATGSGLNFMEELEGIFGRVVGVLNSSVDGKYVYAGTRTNVAPVNVSDLAGLAALGSVDDAFENNDLKRSVAIDDGEMVEFGFLAKDLARDIFQEIKDLKAYNDAVATGPLSGDIGGTKSTYLEGRIAGIIKINQDITSQVAMNGRLINVVDSSIIRNADEDVFVKEFIGSIEDVDLAEAVSRLNLNQVQTEATARMVSQLTRLSLLDFL